MFCHIIGLRIYSKTSCMSVSIWNEKTNPNINNNTPQTTQIVVSGVNKSPSPTLVISTFGLAEIISCMPDGLVKIYIGY